MLKINYEDGTYDLTDKVVFSSYNNSIHYKLAKENDIGEEIGTEEWSYYEDVVSIEEV